jgi:luciferase-like monooxygenase
VTGGARGGPRPPRGTGRGRRDRRALKSGGEGLAGALNRAVGSWDAVRITPMFGRWSYFLGSELFGCYPIRLKEHDLWVRLTPRDQARALAAGGGARPHRRFAARGWIEYDVVEPGELPRALKWLRRAYDLARRERVGEDGSAAP